MGWTTLMTFSKEVLFSVFSLVVWRLNHLLFKPFFRSTNLIKSYLNSTDTKLKMFMLKM